MAFVLVPISVALHVPARRWLIAYAALSTCGIVLVPGIFWAWAGWDRPNGYARRMGITMFVFMQLMIVAMGVSGIELGLLTRSDMLSAAAEKPRRSTRPSRGAALHYPLT